MYSTSLQGRWILLCTTVFTLLSHHTSAWKSSSSQKVLLSNVDVLTLYSDRTTEYRRTKPYPQLTCVGGDAMKYGYRAEVMQCKNMGGSYGSAEDVQWKCTAELPTEFKLGRTEVVCEGYSFPDDPYILKGSCGVEYTLHLTSKGREKYLSPGYKKTFSDFSAFSTKRSSWEPFTSSFFLFRAFRYAKQLITSAFSVMLEYPLVLVVALWMSYHIIRWTIHGAMRWLFPANRRARNPTRQTRRPFWSGFFGGGGHGGGNDPPPPYSRHPRPPSSSRKTFQAAPETQGWTPGFWTGLAGGAAAGYGLGSWTNRNDVPRNQRSARTYTEDPAPQTSGWFEGDGSSYSSHYTQRRRDSDESGTHTSTGFGGTRRR